MKKFAGKNLVVIAALFAMLLTGSQSVFASAANETASKIKVDGVMVITAISQIFYVEAGRFTRAYRAELIEDMSNLELNVARARKALTMFEVEAEQFAVAYKIGQNPFNSDLTE